MGVGGGASYFLVSTEGATTSQGSPFIMQGGITSKGGVIVVVVLVEGGACGVGSIVSY